MITIRQKIEETHQQLNLPSQRHVQKYYKDLICAVSSGQDSSVLLIYLFHVSKKTKMTLTLNYCHHFWQNQNFLAWWHICRLSRTFKIPLYFILAQDRINTEQRATQWRHDAFRRVGTIQKAKCILLGHTANDEIESALWHVIRGTSPIGLSSFNRKQFFFNTCSTKFFLQNPFKKNDYQQTALNKSTFFSKNKIQKVKKQHFILEKNKKGNLVPKNVSISKKKLFFLEVKKMNHFLFEQNSCVDMNLTRPLNTLYRHDITHFMIKNSLPLIPDLTNENLRWSRNRIRQFLLPNFRYFFNPNFDVKFHQFLKMQHNDQLFLTLECQKKLFFLKNEKNLQEKFQHLPSLFQHKIIYYLLKRSRLISPKFEHITSF